MYKHGSSDEIEIFHHPGCHITKSALAYAKAMVSKVVEYEFGNHQLTATQWGNLLSKLNLSPLEIIDSNSAYYKEHLNGMDFDDYGWITVLIKDPHLIKGPIAVRGDKAVLMRSATDIHNL